MSILGKVENMMFLVTLVALLASALGVMTTMTTSVIERRKEIGLLKSIGAENRRIVCFAFQRQAKTWFWKAWIFVDYRRGR